MHPSGSWHPSTPWPRVWPVAALVVALHAVLLHGWQLLQGGAAKDVPVASTMIVRLLTPAPAPSPQETSTAVPAAAPPEATTRALEVPAVTGAGRAPQVIAAPAQASASRPTAVTASRSAAPESDYLPASRLDPGPTLLGDVEPAYPVEAGLAEGKVVLRLLIGTTGTVDEVTVVRATPKGVFDQAAVAAWSAARFSPGRMLGLPVKSQMTIEVHFTPVDRGGNVSPPTY